MIKIYQKGEAVLETVAKKVPLKDIPSKKIKKVIADMKQALAEHEDGIAISAPQIGVSLRIFVISEKAFIFTEQSKNGTKPALASTKKSTKKGTKKESNDLVFINPEIIKLSKEKQWLEEGCLSVRWVYGNVLRAKKTKIRACDEKGRKFERGGSGIMAQIFQHEIDHLNGILFTEKAKDLYVSYPPKNEGAK